MRLSTNKAILLSALLVTACAVKDTGYTIKTRFDPEEVSWATKSGTSGVTGQGFLRTVGGDVKTCAGAEVGLSPVSAYSSELFIAAERGATFAINKDPLAQAAVRRTTCNAQGSFMFKNLPAGAWIVATTVNWQVPVSGHLDPQGGFVQKKVTTSPGEITDVILSR